MLLTIETLQTLGLLTCLDLNCQVSCHTCCFQSGISTLDFQYAGVLSPFLPDLSPVLFKRELSADVRSWFWRNISLNQEEPLFQSRRSAALYPLAAEFGSR